MNRGQPAYLFVAGLNFVLRVRRTAHTFIPLLDFGIGHYICWNLAFDFRWCYPSFYPPPKTSILSIFFLQPYSTNDTINLGLNRLNGVSHSTECFRKGDRSGSARKVAGLGRV